MATPIKKVKGKWVNQSGNQYVGIGFDNQNQYWYGTDGSRTYLRRKGVYRPSPEIINYVKQTKE